jgi:FixJ family two-component response regulator
LKEEMLKAIRAGASDFVEKPLDMLILRKSVNRAFQRFSGQRLDR